MRKLLTPSIAQYKKRYLKHDLIAAAVVTAISVPESLAFAAIVGLPPVVGLYTALVAPVIFGLFASTRRLIVGADSATAALIASGALLVAQAGTAGYANAVGVIGLLVAVLLLLMAVFRLAFLSDLISRPVLIGFLAGVGVQLIVTRLPAMLGIEAHGSLWQHTLTMVQQIGSSNGMAITISVLVVGVILLTRRTIIPGELIGLVLATLFAIIFHVGEYGVQSVGMLPSGLPTIAVPQPTLGMVVTLLPSALSIAIVILAQSSAVIRSAANEHDEKVRLNQDLFALGFANIATSITHGFSANGSPPRTFAAEEAGGRSQMVNIFMGIGIGLILLFGTELFQYIPQAALASVIFVLGFHLIRWQELRYLWETHRTEFLVAMVALVGTALFGVRQGVLIAVVVSLMERLSRQYHPKDAILLRDGQLSKWAIERLGDVSDKKHPKGVLVYSFDGSLFFENITYFTSRVKRAIDNAKEPVRYVLVDAGAIDSTDYTAVEGIKSLYRQLSADNIKLGFAHVSPNLLQQFDDFGITDLVGETDIFPTLTAAITSELGGKQGAADMVRSLNIDTEHYVVTGGAVLAILHLRGAAAVDIAVSDEVYTHYRDEKHWKEYVQESGKKVLSHEGFTLMHGWMGRSFKQLRRDAFVVNDIPLMNIAQLIDSKRRIGRRKDLADIEQLAHYKKLHSTRVTS